MLTHHAQLIEGGMEAFTSLLQTLSQYINITLPHPDITTLTFEIEKFGVDNAHEVRDALLRTPSMSPHTIVVVYAHTLTEQAQNALLKITEEPPVHSYLFLVTNFVGHIIPTLRSRFIILDQAGHDGEVAHTENKDANKNKLFDVKNFLQSPLNIRLEIIKDIHSGLDKETVTIAEVWDFVNMLEKQVHEDIHKKTSTDASIETLEEQEKLKDVLDVLARTQSYMHAPGNSVKMLLEYLAMRV